MTTALALGVMQGAAATAEAHYTGRKTDALSEKDNEYFGFTDVFFPSGRITQSPLRQT